MLHLLISSVSRWQGGRKKKRGRIIKEKSVPAEITSQITPSHMIVVQYSIRYSLGLAISPCGAS